MLRYCAYVGLILVTSACSPGSDKSAVERINRDRFDNQHDEREAQFVVDLLDGAYAIMEVAQMGEKKAADTILRSNAKVIIEEQTAMIVRLKAYAEDHDISIPFSGPARTRNGVKRLYKKESQEFDEEWVEELSSSSRTLEEKISMHLPKADTTLKPVLQYSIRVLKNNQLLILDNK